MLAGARVACVIVAAALAAGCGRKAGHDRARGAATWPADDETGATCADEADALVYVVDNQRTLWRFDPRELPGQAFHRVAWLGCDLLTHPYSMAVDRKGVAWVLYHGGQVHRVSVADGRCLGPAYETPADELFGMGFVRDGAGPDGETLFLADDVQHRLARLDVSRRPAVRHDVAAIGGDATTQPELTGTADGKLFAFFPEDDGGFVQELDGATGMPVGPRLAIGAPPGHVQAWAFAHWGGVFYVFMTRDDDSAVYAVPRDGRHAARVADDLPMRIVGAGVSTCAPLVERMP
ncbi:MAG TPA: hypothetical protein VHE35_32645 [Kofleriaceae bacterium]|nr:hypothetical protein [Kofleriaceae bacterium]